MDTLFPVIRRYENGRTRTEEFSHASVLLKVWARAATPCLLFKRLLKLGGPNLFVSLDGSHSGCSRN